jgi:ribosomal protein S18 acetylase RimI-like enzyme
MSDGVKFEPASAEHYSFALALYLSAMRPYTAELMEWNEPKQVASFARQWQPQDVRIIRHQGRDVGWCQARETPSEIVLQQIFVGPDHQRQGIGTQALEQLLASWQPTCKPVVLTVLKNNPARRLYERLGFAIVGERGIKFEMRRAVQRVEPTD